MTTWYFALYNHSTSTWEFPYAESQDRVLSGIDNGWGMWEVYLPTDTACASYDPEYPQSATTIMTNAQQYSPTYGWIRISNDPYVSTGATGPTYYCGSSPSPYYSLSFFGDGASQWQMSPM